jgi:hypothetical protein
MKSCIFSTVLEQMLINYKQTNKKISEKGHSTPFLKGHLGSSSTPCSEKKMLFHISKVTELED